MIADLDCNLRMVAVLFAPAPVPAAVAPAPAVAGEEVAEACVAGDFVVAAVAPPPPPAFAGDAADAAPTAPTAVPAPPPLGLPVRAGGITARSNRSSYRINLRKAGLSKCVPNDVHPWQALMADVK